MQFKRDHEPTDGELRAWANDEAAEAPMVEWDLMLAFGIGKDQLPIYIELASDTSLAKAPFFHRVLYLWVYQLATSRDFDLNRLKYDRWLDAAKGNRNPVIKRWRRHARLIFQGQVPFEYDSWFSHFYAEED